MIRRTLRRHPAVTAATPASTITSPSGEVMLGLLGAGRYPDHADGFHGWTPALLRKKPRRMIPAGLLHSTATAATTPGNRADPRTAARAGAAR